MFGYYENSQYFYIPELKLPVITTVGNLMQNYTHRQSSIEILCILRGSVHVEVEGTDHALQAGDILTIQKNLAHHYFDGTKDGLQLIYTFDDSILHLPEEQQVDLSTVGPRALPRNHPVINELRSAIGQLVEDIQPIKMRMWRHKEVLPIDSIAWHSIRMEVHHICKLLLQHAYTSTEKKREFPPSLLSCIEYIQQYYQTPCTAEEVANACGFSSRSIRRMFREYMGMSFSEYLTSVRIVAAASLLQDTDCSIADAAADVGLSLSSFYRAFRQETGVSPKEFSEQTRKDNSVYPYLLIPPGQLIHLTQRSMFTAPLSEEVDWDWVAGRKGWDFE